jgi:hypothetical protein
MKTILFFCQLKIKAKYCTDEFYWREFTLVVKEGPIEEMKDSLEENGEIKI